jgi:hypothetical protein|tara:strand:+ start:193 stop:456 length:264 start_codon:yes stop_codon:yes gene_type:complete
LTKQHDAEWIEQSNPAATATVHPQHVAVARVIGDRIETLRTHGFRRTDQTRAAQAVMMQAIAASIGGLRTIMEISDSMGTMFHICSK